jgi:hypothetical protein
LHREVLVIAAMSFSRSSSAHVNRVALYQRTIHVGARIAHGFVLLLYAIGMVGLLFAPPSPFTWRSLPAIVMLVVFPWFVGFVFRTRRVYGSAAGLEYEHRKARHTVPWSEVGLVDYTWWSVSPWGRIAAASLCDGKRRILFFANDAILAELATLRDAALRARRTSHSEKI